MGNFNKGARGTKKPLWSKQHERGLCGGERAGPVALNSLKIENFVKNIHICNAVLTYPLSTKPT